MVAASVVITDTAARAVAGALVDIQSSTGGAVSAWADAAGTIPAAQPGVCDSSGRLTVYLAPGDYQWRARASTFTLAWGAFTVVATPVLLTGVFPTDAVTLPSAARTPTDAMRSLGYYLSIALGQDWEVRFAVEEGAFQRPFLRLTPSAPLESTAHGAMAVEMRRTYAVVAFPAYFDDIDASAMEAARVEDALLLAFARGVMTASFRSNRAHPMRVPLWSFGGVGPAETPEMAAARDGVPRRAANDFMRVDEPPTFTTLPDSDEDRAFIVVGNVRLRWARSIAVPTGVAAAAVMVGGSGG